MGGARCLTDMDASSMHRCLRTRLVVCPGAGFAAADGVA